MATEAEIAWAAGLFEGEGCIHMKQRGMAFTRRVCVTSTDLDVLERLHRIVGLGRIRSGNNPVLNPNWKQNYEWMVTSWGEICAVLEMFLPYLCERRRAKADEMLAAPPCYVRELKDVCYRGHPLAGPDADVLLTSRGARQCRVCVRIVRAERKNGRPPRPRAESVRGAA